MLSALRAVGDRRSYYRAKITVRQEGGSLSTSSERYFPVDRRFKRAFPLQKHCLRRGAPARRALSADSEGFQLPVEGRALHADELRRTGDIAAEPGNLSEEIFAL